MKLINNNLTTVSLICIMFIFGCAFDLARIRPTPTNMSLCDIKCESFTVTQDVILDNIKCGYGRKIKQGTAWVHTGDISEGRVYKPTNTCLTIECSNVFEAYLVLREESIVGFYLPVEKGFVPLRKSAQIITH